MFSKKLYLLLMVLSLNTLFAQDESVKKENSSIENSGPLKGLRKVSFKELTSMGKKIEINPDVTPMYSENLVLLEKSEFMSMITSNEYVIESYVDSNNDIKLFVFRKGTEEELKKIKVKINKPNENKSINNSDLLKGLTKIPHEVYSSMVKKSELDLGTTPIYSEDLDLLEPGVAMSMITSGKYVFDRYVDSKNDIKLIVLRKATEEPTMKSISSNNTDKNKQIGNSDPLKGLKKVSFQDLASKGKKIEINPDVTPIYSENLVLLEKSEFMSMLSSNIGCVPEPYVDSNYDIKLFVLRKATEEEKKKNAVQLNKPDYKKLIGKEAFPFSVNDIFGNKYSLEDLKGKIIVLNFWFIECAPCVMEMPELNKLVEKYKGKDVVFLGFSRNSKKEIKKFLKRKTFNYNLIADSRKIFDLYGVNSAPTTIIIDKNSIISYCASGYNSQTVETIDKEIENLTK